MSDFDDYTKQTRQHRLATEERRLERRRVLVEVERRLMDLPWLWDGQERDDVCDILREIRGQ